MQITCTKRRGDPSGHATPADRDQVDARIVEGVRTKTGRMVNCVAANGTEDCESNAGGWPSYAQNTRPLELPSDYNAVTPSGYTRLENWLQDHARAVEHSVRRVEPRIGR